MLENKRPRSFHNFIRSKGMNRKYASSEQAFNSMQRTVNRLQIIPEPTNESFFRLEIEGPSFAYNQILRLMGLLIEISTLEKDAAETVARCFDPNYTRQIVKAPPEGLILTNQIYEKKV